MEFFPYFLEVALHTEVYYVQLNLQKFNCDGNGWRKKLALLRYKSIRFRHVSLGVFSSNFVVKQIYIKIREGANSKATK